jgi:AcrR family transcriptional regulator
MGAKAARPERAERRGQILDAAFEEFSARGYAGASMAAIAGRASASKETLYAWFDSKAALFNTLLTSRIEGMTSRAYEAARADPSPAHVLPIIAEDAIRFMLAVEPLSRALGAGEHGGEALSLVGRAIGEERQRFVDYILRCRDQGFLAFDDDPFEIVSLFVAMAQGEWSLRLATGMVAELTDEMIAGHARRVTRIFLKGLAPEKT